MNPRPAGRVYEYAHPEPNYSVAYEKPAIDAAISVRQWAAGAKALDFGCGNGWMTAWLATKGFDAVGVDVSESGITIARQAVPKARFSTDTSLDSLLRFGPFDLVLCTEVIAHCFYPKEELLKVFQSLRPGGTLVLTTAYHGYWKNLALALSGHLEHHIDTNWPGAYLHFFSVPAITGLLQATGFNVTQVVRIGRVAPFAKSVLVCCDKPL